MRESRTYGSVRGACDETHVPTATKARVHHAARRRGGGVADCSASAASHQALSHRPTSPTANATNLNAFQQRQELGYVEGRNLLIDYRARPKADRIASQCWQPNW